MTQNGLKWILNTTFKNVTFCRQGNVTFVNVFFKASLRNQWSLIWRSNRTMTLSYPVVSELWDQGKRRNICIIFSDIPSLKSGSLLFPHISWFSVLSGDFSDISVISDFPTVISHMCVIFPPLKCHTPVWYFFPFLNYHFHSFHTWVDSWNHIFQNVSDSGYQTHLTVWFPIVC